MANVTFVSTTLPALAAEAGRRYFQAERALPTPTSNVSFSFGESVMTISASLPTGVAIDATTGKPVITPTDLLSDNDPVLTGTPMASKNIDSLAELLFACAVEIDALENTRIAAGGTLPSGVGVSYSMSVPSSSVTLALPYSVVITADGTQEIVVPNYLA